MFRFLPGILLIQLVTAGLLFALLKTQFSQELLLIIIGLSLMLSVLAALWFASIATHRHKDLLSRTIEQYAREREDIRVKAEQQKIKIIRESQRQISRETSRAHAKANFKVGAAFAGVAAVGALMLFTQFVTAGLLLMSTAGGGVMGYLIRRRQELRVQQKLIETENQGLGKLEEKTGLRKK